MNQSERACPACGLHGHTKLFTCVDHSVSKEKFDIVHCNHCNFTFTDPVPAPDKLPSYYESEAYISHTDTNKGLVARLYLAVRSYTLKKKLRLVQKYVSRGTILDYGCGTGEFLRVCREGGWNGWGVEPSADAGMRARNKGATVVQELSSLEQPDFNAITLWHVLEHVVDLKGTLAQFKSRLKPEGTLFIAVPNHRSYDAQHYGEFWAAYDVPRHLYHFDRDSLPSIMKNAGFSLVEILPMKFDSYYVSMLSEKYKHGRVRLFSAFMNGWRSNSRSHSSGDYSSLVYVFRHLK